MVSARDEREMRKQPSGWLWVGYGVWSESEGGCEEKREREESERVSRTQNATRWTKSFGHGVLCAQQFTHGELHTYATFSLLS